MDNKTNLKDVKRQICQIIDGQKIYSPLFSEEELKRAEPIVQCLEGMTIRSAKDLLERIKEAIDYVTIMH